MNRKPTTARRIAAAVAHRLRGSACLLALGLGLAAVPQLAWATLQINKSFQPINIAPGQTSILTIDLFNDELVALSNTQFSDALPTGITIVGSPTPTTTCTGGTVTAPAGGTSFSLSGGTVPGGNVNGTSGRCQVVLTVTSSTSGTLINTIPTGAASGDSAPNGGLGPQSNAQPASATLTVAAYASLAGSKDFPNADPDFVKGNGTAPFTITINNPNAAAVSGLAFTDTFPAQLRFSGVSFSNTCGGTLTDPASAPLLDGATGLRLAGGSIAANGSCTISAVVRAANPNTVFNAVQTNTIPAGTITTTQGAVNAAPLAASIAVQTGGSTAKSFAPTAIVSDGVASSTLTLRLQNLNVVAINGAALTDSLPSGIAVAATPNITSSASCAGPTVAAAPGATSIAISNATVPAAANVINAIGECIVTVDVVTTTPGPLANTIPAGSYGAGLPSYAGSSATLTGNNVAVTLAKNFSPATVAAGGTTTLTITLSNTSSQPAQISAFTDDLTTGGSNIVIGSGGASTSCGGTVSATAGGTVITKNDGTIPAGSPGTPGTCTITVPVTLQPGVTVGTHTNIIQANALQTNRGSNAASAQGSLVVPTNISGSKGFAPDTVPIGTQSTLVITLDNNTATPAAITSLTDSLLTLDPGGRIVVAGTAITRGCGGTVNAAIGGTQITKTDGSVPANSSCDIVVPIVASPGAPVGTFTNTIPAGAIVTSQGSTQNPITAGLTIISPITGSKSFSPSTIVRGQSTTLTVRISNSSSTAATGLTFSDALTTLDAGGNFTISSTPAAVNGCGGTLTASAGATSFSLSGGTVPATGFCEVSLSVTAGTNAPTGTSTNTVPSGAVTTSLGSNLAPFTAGLVVNSAVTISKSFSPSTVGAGQVSRLSVQIDHANGAPALTGLALADDLTTLGAGHVVAATPNLTSTCGGTPTATAGASTFGFTNGTLGAGATSCTIAVNVQTPNTLGTGTNTIPAGALTTTQGITNDTPATATLTRTTAVNNLTLNKSFSPTSVSGGGSSVLTVLVNNSQAGAINLDSVTLVDNLPAGMVVFSTPNPVFTGAGCANATITAVAGSSSVSFTGATIAAGSTCSLTVNVTGTVDGNLTNTIPANTVTSTQGVTNSNAPQATLTILRNIIVEKSFSPDTIVTGTNSILTLRFTNTQATARTNGSLIDTFPAGLVTAGPATQNTCGAGSTVTNGAGGALAAGASSIRLNGATFAANSSCVISVPVTSAQAGVYTNTIPAGTLTTTDGTTNMDPGSGTITNLGAPTIVKAFSPSTIAINGTSTITFTIANPNNGVLLPGGFTGASFTDTLTGFSIAANGAAGGTCTGAAGNTFTAGQTALSFNGLAIPVSSSCTVTVVVTGATAGTFPNTASGVTTAQAPTSPGPPSNTVNLSVLAPPTVAKAFVPSSIVTGTVSRLTITLTNPNTTVLTVASPGLVDLFPTTPGQLSVAATPNLATTCAGATVNDAANAPLAGGALGVRVNNGTIPASGSCTVSVDVTASVVGSYVNTTGLLSTTNAGSSAAGGTATLSVTLTPAGVPLTGTIYRDANTNGTLDGSENWTAGTPVFVNLVQGGVVVATTTVNPGTGAYTFSNVTPGNYSIVVTNTSTSITPAAPTGFQFVVPNDGTQIATVGTTGSPPYNFGLIDGGTVTGRVFRDSGPTANNGIQESGANEPGLQGVIVRLTDCAATVYATSTTDANGDYRLYVPSTVIDGSAVCIEETNPAGYLSTGANVANTVVPSGAATTVSGTSYSYTRTSTPDRTQFVYATAVRNYSNVNFGDVPPNAFTTDNKQTALPGTTQTYGHTYTAQTGGTVTFTTSAAANPAVTGWTETLYLDANCNGAIEPSEAVIAGPITLLAGQQVCIIDKEAVPANAPTSAQNLVTVTATFNYTNAGPALGSVLTHTDTTIVGDATGAALNLVKSVSSGTATPGSVLTYTVTYTNRSTQPLTNIVVNDATPPYTSFVSATAGPLPASLAACSKTTPAGGPVACASVQAAGGRGALSWTFTGALQPGGTGVVTFNVVVDP